MPIIGFGSEHNALHSLENLSFDGWKERENLPYFAAPSGYDGPMVAWPRTYFLSTGWRRYGLISIDEVPGCHDDD